MKYWVLFAGMVVFCLLVAFKNPFSINSLVPNLEPYPDSLYYATPAWNVVHNKSFDMSIPGFEVKLITPPLYSLYLIPFFAVIKDVRVFYVANLLLILATLLLFGWWLKIKFQSFKNGFWLVAMGMFLLVSTFYFYNLPGLLMAESLVIFLVVCLLLAFEIKKNGVKSFLLGLISALLMLVKVSDLPISAVVYSWLVIDCVKRRKWSELLWPTLFVIGVGAYFGLSHFLVGHKNLTSVVSFSIDYFETNFKFYVKALFGEKTTYLWYQEILIFWLTGWLALGGSILVMIKKVWSDIWVVSIAVGVVIFMSFFITPDVRYVVMLLPIIIYMAVKSVSFVSKGQKLLLAIWLCLYLGTNAKLVMLKQQVGLNFRHREVPWNYIAMDYYRGIAEKDPNSCVASFLPPYYFNLYWHKDLCYLPINSNQEFMVNYPILESYKQKLSEGKNIYISDYYVTNNMTGWGKDIDVLKKYFNFSKIGTGCEGICVVYKLSNK